MRILIADDEAIIRMGLRTILRDLGHQVVGAAADGATAIRLAGTLRPDLVILDIKMPDVDGLTAAERIAADRPVPILILTAYSDRDLVDRAATLAVQGYLVKPAGDADLATAIEMVVGRFREWQALQKEATTLQEALQARDLVERAKRRLVEREGLSERDAFLRIQHRSRRQRRPMAEIARAILLDK